MKSITKKVLLIISLVFIPTGVISSVSYFLHQQKSNTSIFHQGEEKQPDINVDGEEDDINDPDRLVAFDYFKSKKLSTGLYYKKEKIKLKSETTDIVKRYRLLEWNEYYEKSDNPLIKSNVLEPSWSDFKEDRGMFGQEYKMPRNSVYNKEINWYTDIYFKQDSQFRYFNNLINILGDEIKGQQPDFLYNRWLYYSLRAANKYHTVKYKGKHIYDVNAKDFVVAIGNIFIGNTEDIKELIKAFMKYYGFTGNIDFPNFYSKSIFSIDKYIDIDINLIDESIVHAYLCAKDMSMRYSMIPEYDINKYKLLRAKAKRARRIEKKMFKHYSLITDLLPTEITDSDLGDIGIEQPDDQEIDVGKANEYLDSIKQFFMKFLDVISNFAKLKTNEYLSRGVDKEEV